MSAAGASPIHIGGTKGQVVQQRYTDISYDATDKDASADINTRTPRCTYVYLSLSCV